MFKPLPQLNGWSQISLIASGLGGCFLWANVMPVQAQNVVIRYSVISPYYNSPAAPLLLTPGGFVPLQPTQVYPGIVYPGSYVCIGSCPGTSSIAAPSFPFSPIPNATAPIYAPNGIRNSTLYNPTLINSPIYNSTLINPRVVQPTYPTNGFAAPIYPGGYPGGFIQPSVRVIGR